MLHNRDDQSSDLVATPAGDRPSALEVGDPDDCIVVERGSITVTTVHYISYDLIHWVEWDAGAS